MRLPLTPRTSPRRKLSYRARPAELRAGKYGQKNRTLGVYSHLRTICTALNVPLQKNTKDDGGAEPFLQREAHSYVATGHASGGHAAIAFTGPRCVEAVREVPSWL